MTDWTQYLGNSLPIKSVYSTVPSLTNVRLQEIRLHQDGPRVSLRIDLNSFPENPPRKWIAAKFNRVQLTLLLIDISELYLRGWNLNNIGDLNFVASDARIAVAFDGESVKFECNARFVEVEKLSGYFDSYQAL